MGLKFNGSQIDLKKVLSLYGIKPSGVKPIKDGIINSSFVVSIGKSKKYVLRIYQKGHRNNSEILYEVALMDKLRLAGIPVPKVEKNIKNEAHTKFTDSAGNRWRAILMEFIEGEHLKPSSLQIIPEFARIQARMHLIFSKSKPGVNNSFAKMIAWLESESSRAVKLLPNNALAGSLKSISDDIILETKKRKKEIFLLPFGYVHLDYDSNNIIVAGNRIRAVLDFDDISPQPFILDTANSLWWWLFFNAPSSHRVIIEKYVKNYAKYRKLTATEKNILPLFIRIRNATMASLLFVNNPKKPDLKSLRKALKADEVFKEISTNLPS